MKREAGGQGEFSVGRIIGAATPPGALVHVKKVHVKKVTVTFFFALLRWQWPLPCALLARQLSSRRFYFALIYRPSCFGPALRGPSESTWHAMPICSAKRVLH